VQCAHLRIFARILVRPIARPSFDARPAVCSFPGIPQLAKDSTGPWRKRPRQSQNPNTGFGDWNFCGRSRPAWPRPCKIELFAKFSSRVQLLVSLTRQRTRSWKLCGWNATSRAKRLLGSTVLLLRESPPVSSPWGRIRLALPPGMSNGLNPFGQQIILQGRR
jgi:hypothetical protein